MTNGKCSCTRILRIRNADDIHVTSCYSHFKYLNLRFTCTRYKIFYFPIKGSERHWYITEKYSLNFVIMCYNCNEHATCILF